MILRPLIPVLRSPLGQPLGGDTPAWEVGSGGSSVWTPLADTGLAAWWQVGAETVLSGSDIVTVGDLSANGRDATEGTNRPVYNAANSNMGNRPSADFTTANSDKLRASGFTLGASFSVYIICRNTATTTDVVFDSGTTNVTTIYINTTWRLNCGAEIDSGIGGTQTRAICCSVAAGTGSIFIDNWSSAAQSGAVGGGTINGVTLGANRDAVGNFFAGSIAEVILTSSTSAASRALYRQYFNDRRYGVTIT